MTSTNSSSSSNINRTKQLKEPVSTKVGNIITYAKLKGDGFCYYVRTLQVTFGRKASTDNVDVPLGNTKAVSRQHAKILYNFDLQRFELTVFGKNGAFVNEKFIEKGVTVPLENKTKIQLGEKIFIFLLPKPGSSNTDKTEIKHFELKSQPCHTKANKPKNLKKEEEDDENTRKEKIKEIGNKDRDREIDRIGLAVFKNRDVKPPYPYVVLITEAIMSSEDKKITLEGIYNFISTNFPYFKHTKSGWKNSVRHNLSLNSSFIKVPRHARQRGKGAFWTIDPNSEGVQSTSYSRKTLKNPLSEFDENDRKKPRLENRESLRGHGSAANQEYERQTSDNKSYHKTVPLVPDEYERTNTRFSPLLEQQIDGPPPQNSSYDVYTSSTKFESRTLIQCSSLLVEYILNSKEVHIPRCRNTEVPVELQLQNIIEKYILNPANNPLPPFLTKIFPKAVAQLPEKNFAFLHRLHRLMN